MTEMLVFIVGAVTGAGLMAWHERTKDRAVTKVTAVKNAIIRKLRVENDQLCEDAHNREYGDAYRYGQNSERAKNEKRMSPARAFAEEWEKRENVRFVDTTKTA